MKKYFFILLSIIFVFVFISCQTLSGYTNKNIAIGKSATSNSNENDDVLLPNLAIDGYSNTRWSSNRINPGRASIQNPHILIIDLKKQYSLHKIVVNIQGEDNHKQTFKLFVSSDNNTWIEIGGEELTTGIFTFKLNYEARYVKYESQYSSDNGQVNVYEIEVY